MTNHLQILHLELSSSYYPQYLKYQRMNHSNPEHSEEHKLVVYVQMDDGKKYYYSFDVTDALHDPNTPGGSEPGGTIDMELEIDGLPLPEPIEDSSNTGLNPEVDGWEEITIGIEL